MSQSLKGWFVWTRNQRPIDIDKKYNVANFMFLKKKSDSSLDLTIKHYIGCHFLTAVSVSDTSLSLWPKKYFIITTYRINTLVFLGGILLPFLLSVLSFVCLFPLFWSQIYETWGCSNSTSNLIYYLWFMASQLTRLFWLKNTIPFNQLWVFKKLFMFLSTGFISHCPSWCTSQHARYMWAFCSSITPRV